MTGTPGASIAQMQVLIKSERSFIYKTSSMRVRDPGKEHAIRERALDMIVAHGFDGLSMQKLAKAAGVSPATIYIYFKNRDDLIVSLLGHKAGRVHGVLDTIGEVPAR